MTTHLAAQHTYDTVELAVFRDKDLIQGLSLPKFDANKKLLTSISRLLEDTATNFQDLSFIAANQGPGPFTTMRVVITTLNGINFATKIPLVGVDGLQAFAREYKDDTHNTAYLLKAFSGDVYFGLQKAGHVLETGWAHHADVLARIQSEFDNTTIRFMGNGTELYRTEITAAFGKQAYIPNPLPHTCSIEQIGRMGFEQWQKKENIVDQMLPLYLKTQQFKKSMQ